MSKVSDFIYRDTTSVNATSDIKRVIRTMVLHRLSAIPVVNELGEYIGCISEIELLDASIPEYMKSIYNTSFMANLNQIIASDTIPGFQLGYGNSIFFEIA